MDSPRTLCPPSLPSWSLSIGESNSKATEPLLHRQEEASEVCSRFAADDMTSISRSVPHVPCLDLSIHATTSHRRYLSYPLSAPESDVYHPEISPLNHSGKLCSSGEAEGLLASNASESSFGEQETSAIDESGLASPTSDLATPSPTKAESVEEGVDFDGFGMPVEEIDELEDGRTLTAAEIRAQKRKMKRFRLTHNQTRYLMSEFARQAHPDAAHRERLARDIPGLSSRQVQVWFQNRRAKLKHLTQDDRENIVRSRALPDNFSMSQALQSPFNCTTSLNPFPASPVPQLPTGSIARQSSMETLLERRNSDASTAAGGMHIDSSYITPPQSGKAIFSPVSSVGVNSPFSRCSPSFGSAPNMNTVFPSSNPGFTSYAEMPPLLEETTGFNNSEFSNQLNNMAPDMRPYGLGFSYTTIPGFHTSSHLSMRNVAYHPGKVKIPSNPSERNDTPQTSSQPPCSSPPLSSPGNISMLSAPATITSFPTYTQ